jgi:hypothetical protein
MSLITAISPTVVPPNPVKKDVHIPGGPNVTPNHLLYIDLSSWHSRPMEVPDAEDDPQFLLSIRDAIYKSRQPREIPIDAVSIACCTGSTPDPALWEALAGARPSHLEMSAGWDETCNYYGLNKVQPPWDLKSMYLAAYEGDGSWDWNLKDATRQSHSFPACYANLETLILDYPGGYYLYFYPEGGATNLRSLTILENDSVTVFARTVDCNPKLVETLRSVTLACFIPDAGKSVRRMKRFFKEAKGLVNLELAMGDVKWYPQNSYEAQYEEDPHQAEGQSETSFSTVTVAATALPAPNDSEGEAGSSIPPVLHQIRPFRFGGEGESDDSDDSDYGDGYVDEDSDDDDDDEDVDEDEVEDEDEDDLSSDDEELPTYAGLLDVLPSTLQHFSLRGPANPVMLKELDDWIGRAHDQSWLTNLRTFAFKLVDPPQKKPAGVVYLTEKEKEKLGQKIQEMFNILRQRSPPVEVVEPRPVAQLRYPPTLDVAPEHLGPE